MAEFTEDTLLTRYQELCSKRDAKYAETAPLEKELDETVAAMESMRVKARDLGLRIDAILGPDHLSMKKEIALLARALSRPNGPLAKKD